MGVLRFYSHSSRIIQKIFIFVEWFNHCCVNSSVAFVGPGCSSFRLEAFSENGSFRPGGGGLLVRNDFSWNKGSS